MAAAIAILGMAVLAAMPLAFGLHAHGGDNVIDVLAVERYSTGYNITIQNVADHDISATIATTDYRTGGMSVVVECHSKQTVRSGQAAVLECITDGVNPDRYGEGVASILVTNSSWTPVGYKERYGVPLGADPIYCVRSHNTHCLEVDSVVYDPAPQPTQPQVDTSIPDGFTVFGATYHWGNGTLALQFTGRVDIFSMDISGISITDGRCALAFALRDYDTVSQDRMSVVIRLNEIHRESLASMTGPHIQFREGSFRESGTGEEMAPVRIPLHVTGDPPEGEHKCVITYGSHEGLLTGYAHDYNQTLQAVHDGFAAWSDLNPYLEFVWVDRDPLIWINWVDYQQEYIGLACVWCLGEDPSMEVIVYGYDCRGARIHHDPNTVRNTVAHELGHILGLGHHVNKTHLMYGPEYQVDPYEAYGYVVPDQLEERFVGEAELYVRVMALEEELNRLVGELDRLRARGDTVGNTIYFDSQNQVNQYKRLASEYGSAWDEYDTAYDELKCMYEARDPWATPDLSNLQIMPP